ncbi:hypothetical protein Tco_0368014 [Tanacetum coccineum]
MSLKEMEDLKQHYLDEMLSLSKFNGMSIEINKKKELQRLEKVANLSTYSSQHFKYFCYDEDDDYDYEKSTIPLNEIDSQIPPSIAITPVLPTMEPEDSHRNGELSTIPEKESYEFIKSRVEDLVPIPIRGTSSAGNLYDSNLMSQTFLVTPFPNSNEMSVHSNDNVELLLHHDSSTPMISVVSILEGFTNEPPLKENDDLFDLESKNL